MWFISGNSQPEFKGTLSRHCRELLEIKQRPYLLREVDELLKQHVDKSGQIHVNNLVAYSGIHEIPNAAKIYHENVWHSAMF